MSALPQTFWNLEPMAERHLPFVMEIEQRAYPFPWTEGIFRDCLRAGYSGWVVTSPTNDLLGYAWMSMAVQEAHILNLCVDPAHQSQGIGKFLLMHLLDVARSAGMELMLLEVRKSNTPAIALYKNNGFQKLGVRKGYYPAHDGTEDAWLLGCTLTRRG